MDIAGLDVLAHVMRNLHERLPNEADRAAFAMPPFLQQMLDKGLARRKDRPRLLRTAEERIGRKRDLDARSGTLEYRPKQSARIPSIEAGKSIDDVARARQMLFNAKDKAGEFLRETLAPTLVYTARVTPDIAHSIDDVDRVMRWGFGWELGPVRAVRRHRRARGARRGRGGGRSRDGRGVPPLVSRCSTAAGTASGRPGAARGAGPVDPPHGARAADASSRRTPARASSISATACSASSSTRR